MSREDQKVFLARMRIAQTALVAAMDVNRALLTNDCWQHALASVNQLIQEESAEPISTRRRAA